MKQALLTTLLAAAILMAAGRAMPIDNGAAKALNLPDPISTPLLSTPARVTTTFDPDNAAPRPPGDGSPTHWSNLIVLGLGFGGLIWMRRHITQL